MPASEDLFTAVHKAIRSMIYDVSGRLQSADFSDRARSVELLADLQHEFSTAVSATCVLCLLHLHARHEEKVPFPAMESLEPALVRALIEDHQEIQRRMTALARSSSEFAKLESPEERLAAGARINREANEFFAFYLGHMNKEEDTIVPAMQAHFTDEQMRAMQATIIGSMERERLAGFLYWMLPSLSLNELTALIAGVKDGAPPELLQLAAGIGAARVDPARWAVVRQRVGF
jgi:FPC/CPF motif-containing protein YcgG